MYRDRNQRLNQDNTAIVIFEYSIWDVSRVLDSSVAIDIDADTQSTTEVKPNKGQNDFMPFLQLNTVSMSLIIIIIIEWRCSKRAVLVQEPK